MAYSFASIEELGDGVFRKVRRALGVTAFGVNAMVLPPGTEWFEHYHEHQDELYFVHAGKAGFEGRRRAFRARARRSRPRRVDDPRRFWNASDGDLVLLLVGGKNGYVERDGKMVDPADEERRRAFSAGDLGAIRAKAT